MKRQFAFAVLILVLNWILPVNLYAGEPFLKPAPTPAMPAPTTDSDSSIVWKAQRPLTWHDFRAPTAETDPLHALTSSNLDVQVSCADDKLTVAVQAVFRPLESWTKNRTSENLLRHEQLHFDLTEVHARLLRQRLLATRLTCVQARTQLKPLIDAAFAAWQREQDRYDAETNHGLDRPAQARWAASIEKRLADLPM